MQRYLDAFRRGQQLAYRWVATWPKALQPPADSDVGRKIKAIQDETRRTQPSEPSAIEELTEAQKLAVQALRDMGMRKLEAVHVVRESTNARMSDAEAVTAVLRATRKGNG